MLWRHRIELNPIGDVYGMKTGQGLSPEVTHQLNSKE